MDWLYQTPQAASNFFDGVAPESITAGTVTSPVTLDNVAINELAEGSLINIQGWAFSGAFSATDSDTVAWAAGTITLGDGTTFSINAGNTGNISAVTYIYFDKSVSETVLQTTTTAGTAVGGNKIMMCVAKNETGKNATFQAFGGKGIGTLVTADNIAANTITANEIASNTITANQISTAIINAGKITAGYLTASNITTGTLNASVVTISNLTVGTNVSVGSSSNYTSIVGDIVTTGYVNALGITVLGAVTAGSLTGVTVTSSSGNNKVVLNNGDTMDFYYGGSIVGQIYGVSGYVEISGTDAVGIKAAGTTIGVFREGDKFVPSAESTGSLGDVDPIADGWGSWAKIYVDTIYDTCLWLDEEDDLALLRACKPQKDKEGKYVLDKDIGKPKLDNTSLPNWMSKEEDIRRGIIRKRERLEKEITETKGKKKEKKLQELETHNNLTEREIIASVNRNLGHFVDLVAGAVRQLADKVDILETKLNK